jgi:hypothetical protein
MKKSVIIILLISSFITNCVLAQITATQMGMLDFKVDQSLTAAEMNGTTDVTIKLQAAVDKARKANKTLFIPTGTYKVSNTIKCVLEFSGWSMLTPVCIVGSSISRPTIVLADNASGFSGANPKCVFKYTATVHTTPDCIMEGGIRSLNFDLGNGNYMAVAVNWGCAQYCFTEDISVEARNGFAGFLAIGGANQLLSNVTVNGGQYGIYLPDHNEAIAWGLSGEICQSTVTGCTFTNQSENALHLWGYGGITMSGITISQASGTAIFMKGDSYAPVICFPFSLIDSKITFTSPGSSNTAISNLSHCNLALNGLYVTGAGTITDNDGDENLVALTPLSSWTNVARFNYIDKKARYDGHGTNYSGKHFNSSGGILSTAAIVQVDASLPPADLTSKHIWASTPSFEDADAFLVPAASSASTIQNAIDTHQKVFLAKGNYTLNAPITLKANSIFCGCPGIGKCGSNLTNSFSSGEPTWLINTEDDADATTYLMDVTTNTTGIDNMGSLNWMAGANSIIRTIHLDKNYQDNEPNMIRLYFSGNGGGRVFNYQDEKGASGTQDPGHRKVEISGTWQPLTFYGLNLERGGDKYPVSSWPMLEIDNASNVQIFGAKTEAFQPYATINSSSNIFITNLVDYCANGYGSTGANQIEIKGTSDQIELSNLIWLGPPDDSWKLVSDLVNANSPSRQQFVGLYHRNWTSFWNFIPTSTFDKKSSDQGWNVSPNPTSLNVYISSKINRNDQNKVFVYNSLGVLVKTINIKGKQTLELKLSDCVSGLYNVVIQEDNGQKSVYKVIKN